MSHHSAEEAANDAMSPPAASSLAAASSAISAASGSHSGARGRLSCGLRFGTSHAGSLGCCQRSIVPSSWTIVRNGTPDLHSAHIAAFAERHTHHCAPARSSASRAASLRRTALPAPRFQLDRDRVSRDTKRDVRHAGFDAALLAHRSRWSPMALPDRSRSRMCRYCPAICRAAERASPARAIPRGVPRARVNSFRPRRRRRRSLPVPGTLRWTWSRMKGNRQVPPTSSSAHDARTRCGTVAHPRSVTDDTAKKFHGIRPGAAAPNAPSPPLPQYRRRAPLIAPLQSPS